MALPFPGQSGDHRKTLARVLAAGPMPLSPALKTANEIAGALREIHEQGRAHGGVSAATIELTEGGAELEPARSWDEADTRRDIRDFGSLLFQMLTGAPPQAGELPVPSRLPGPRSGPAGLRVSAIQIAGNCFGEGSFQPTMQQVLTELRLLAVLLKMQGDGPAALPPAPFLVSGPAAPRKRPAAKTDAPGAELRGSEPAGSGHPTAPVVPLGPTSFGQPSQKPLSDVSPKGAPCPKCDSSPVYVSRPRSRFEAFLVRMNVPICRCHSCYHRYFVFAMFKIRKEMPVGPQRRRRPHRRRR